MGKRSGKSNWPTWRSRKSSGKPGLSSSEHIPKKRGGPQRPPWHSGTECHRGAHKKLVPLFRCTKKTSWRDVIKKNTWVHRTKRIREMTSPRQQHSTSLVTWDDLVSFDYLPALRAALALQASNPAPAYFRGAGGRMRRLRVHESDDDEIDERQAAIS